MAMITEARSKATCLSAVLGLAVDRERHHGDLTWGNRADLTFQLPTATGSYPLGPLSFVLNSYFQKLSDPSGNYTKRTLFPQGKSGSVP